MREIIFRGKRIDNGEWIYGVPAQDEHGETVIIENVFECGEYDCRGAECLYVDENSIGQYTGLTDKNGTKIFEGDVLKIDRIGNGLGDYYIPPLPYPVNVAVKWDLCGWMWETLCEDKRYIQFPDAWCHFRCEVIGNIHDNPELMKGEQE